VIEVQLTTMQVRALVSSAPSSDETLTDTEMSEMLADVLEDNGCLWSGPLLGEHHVAGFGSFSWVDAPPSDSGAGALFDTRTGEMVFSMATDWTAWDVRCSPQDPLTEYLARFTEADEPGQCFRYCSSDACVDSACHEEIDRLNSTGDSWSRLTGDEWTHRTYEEVWSHVRKTAAANAFSECGPYELFVRGLSTPGGAGSGDLDALRMVFVLAGYADVSVISP
jgi:hypothetical protein